MTQEEFETFTEKWEDLKYFDIEGVQKARTTGFNAKSKGLFLFAKIFRFIESDIKGDVHVCDEQWKMNFTIEQEPEHVELDEEDGDATPLPKITFDVEICLFAEDPDEESPDLIYVQIQRKQGDLVAFGKFVKRLMKEGELQIFVEPEEEE